MCKYQFICLISEYVSGTFLCLTRMSKEYHNVGTLPKSWYRHFTQKSQRVKMVVLPIVRFSVVYQLIL